jgi:hypothetical protein
MIDFTEQATKIYKDIEYADSGQIIQVIALAMQSAYEQGKTEKDNTNVGWVYSDFPIGKTFIGPHQTPFTVIDYFNERGNLYIQFRRYDGAIRSSTLDMVHTLIGEKK